MAVACSKNLSLRVIAGNTPCDLSTPDDTVIAENSSPNPSILNDTLTYPAGFGEYEFRYTGGAYFSNDNPFPGAWKITLYDAIINDGSSVNSLVFFGSYGGPDQSTVETQMFADPFATRSFLHTGTFISHAILGSNPDGFIPGSPNPTWKITRTIKFAVPPASRLRVSNYSLFAAGRWTASHGGDTTSPMAYNATSGQVQTELNNLASIIAEGGVTVSGSLAAGWQVTWNVNGARALLTAAVTTITFAPLFSIVETTPGNAGTAEVQTITLTLDCGGSAASAGAEWDGTIPNRTLLSFSQIEWKADPTPGNLSINNGKSLYTAEVRYSTSLGALTTTGCGWVFTVGEMDGSSNFILLYQGICGTGSDGSGQFTRNDSVDVGDGLMCRAGAGPATVTIESY